ncbi:hypothetical protein CC86DRAFT_365743 [Ophiobolus disseminans]|uniref:Uncharacterized protein n=1 Tax=Ophiobolus disseminans TaxID=1469910 RepID=A0A6A7AL64_9PLEO|nr:hypothetical protein CC86DRAFT_365743 [Ophiobolus disseminans]
MTDGSRASSRSRRSYPNLHSLSLAPLSAKYPLDASAPPSPDEPAAQTPRTSYMAQKSAPATPGILSLSQSRSNSRTRSSRHRSKPIYAYDAYFVNPENPVRDAGDIPKAKSTNTLHPGVSFADEPLGSEKRHHVRKGTAPLPLRMPLVRHHTSEADDEWWYRAGLAIAGETRDSKGQGWLVRRESSTSLVKDNDDDGSTHHDPKHMALMSGEHINLDTDFPTFSPRMSRAGSRYQSRVGSRVPSARQSRRASRVGSRADLLMTPGASARHSLDLPSLDSHFMEPDFVDEHDDESSGDEEEVARLARERGFGLGSWMDRLIGWTLFDVDEDGEASDEEDDEDEDVSDRAFLPENMTREELRLRREVEAKRRKLERESIIAASALKAKEEKSIEQEGSRPSTSDSLPPEEEGGWQDAAWLLSVASKALF